MCGCIGKLKSSMPFCVRFQFAGSHRRWGSAHGDYTEISATPRTGVPGNVIDVTVDVRSNHSVGPPGPAYQNSAASP